MNTRAVYKIRSYVGQKTLFDNKVYTITTIYHSSDFLNIYAVYSTAFENSTDSIEYRMTQLRSFAMTDAPNTFRKKTDALRNSRDWAKKKREEFITAANSKISNTEYSEIVSVTQSLISPSLNEFTHAEFETSADELALEIDTSNSSSHKSSANTRTILPPKIASNGQSKKASRVNRKPDRRPGARRRRESCA